MAYAGLVDVPANPPPDLPPRARPWRQEAILAAVRASYRMRGLSPTFLEIAAATGITTTSVVSYNLRRLQEQGLVKVENGASRGIRLVLQPGDPCPLCGHESEGS